MNWIERLYDIQKLGRKDFYSQNGEGLYLEYIFEHIEPIESVDRNFVDIGGSDFFYLSNTRYLRKSGWLAFGGVILDKEIGYNITAENILSYGAWSHVNLVSIDIDGNDYWIIQQILTKHTPSVIIAEFNPAFTDSRTIKYNPDHVWDGTDYYGFSFEAGKKLAEANGYKVIFQVADMNMIMVREDLIKVPIPLVTFKPNSFFKYSGRPESDWVFV